MKRVDPLHCFERSSSRLYCILAPRTPYPIKADAIIPCIIATRTQLTELGHHSLTIFQDQVGKLSSVWTFACNDAKKVELMSKDIDKDVDDIVRSWYSLLWIVMKLSPAGIQDYPSKHSRERRLHLRPM